MLYAYGLLTPWQQIRSSHAFSWKRSMARLALKNFEIFNFTFVSYFPSGFVYLFIWLNVLNYYYSCCCFMPLGQSTLLFYAMHDWDFNNEIIIKLSRENHAIKQTLSFVFTIHLLLSLELWVKVKVTDSASPHTPEQDWNLFLCHVCSKTISFSFVFRWTLDIGKKTKERDTYTCN